MSQNTQRLLLTQAPNEPYIRWSGYALEFMVSYAHFGLVCKIDDGMEFEVQPGLKYRNIQDGVAVPFRRLTFRKPNGDGTTLTLEIIISDASIDDGRVFPVLSPNVTFDMAVIELVTYTPYDLTKFNGQRVELRANHKNAHEIMLSAVASPSFGGGGGNAMSLVPGEAPIILQNRSTFYIAKGTSLGYGTNTHPILNIITHY